MTATDAKTVTVKLAKPQASILAAVSSRAASGFWVLPKEAESAFDVKKDQRGSGPYVLAEYVPSSRFVYEKSTGYWNRDKLMVQRVEFPIIGEYAQSQAQFKAGNLYAASSAGANGSWTIRPEDVLPTKNEVSSANLFLTDVATSGFRWFFGWEPSNKSPFKDVRLRQAMSMSIDRDLFIDAFYNVPVFEAEGISMSKAWNTASRCDAVGWWLDPQGKDFGENAKFFKYDVAEVKKLLSAAGFANGLDVDAHHITTGDYGAAFPNQVQTLIGMATEAGIRLKSLPANFSTDWQQKYRDVKGNFDGMGPHLRAQDEELSRGDLRHLG
jgi:peptide/nickel transport system substrate-binding protein